MMSFYSFFQKTPKTLSIAPRSSLTSRASSFTIVAPPITISLAIAECYTTFMQNLTCKICTVCMLIILNIGILLFEFVYMLLCILHTFNSTITHNPSNKKSKPLLASFLYFLFYLLMRYSFLISSYSGYMTFCTIIAFNPSLIFSPIASYFIISTLLVSYSNPFAL